MDGNNFGISKLKKIARSSKYFKSIQEKLKDKKYIMRSCTGCPFNNNKQTCDLVYVISLYYNNSFGEFRKRNKIDVTKDFCTDSVRKLLFDISMESFHMEVE